MNKEENIRHSLSHILAIAIKEKHPDVKFGFGPAIENGFYYDFDNLKITEEDLKEIEKRMKHLVKQNLTFEQKEISKKEDFEKNNPAIQIFSPDFFIPKNLRTQKIEATSNTYSIHYFNGSWLTPQQIKHIKMRTRLCNRYGERLGEISSSLFALFSSVKIDGIKNTLKKLLEKIKFVFQSPK